MLKTEKRILLLACVAALVAIAAVTATAAPPALTGERIKLKQVLIPLYDWDTGKVIVGSTPVNCQYVDTCAPKAAKTLPKDQVQPFYLVVYPMGVNVPVQCKHFPYDDCPDHGPVIAKGAMQLVPSVYGNGVLGHNHLSAPLGSPEFRPFATPELVLFKNRAAAKEFITTKKQVMAAVKRGDAFLFKAPQYTFINFIVPSNLYPEGKPVEPVKTTK